MSTTNEPSSLKALIGSILLSIAMLLLVSQFITERVTLRNISKVELRSVNQQVYAEAIPEVLVPTPSEPVIQPTVAPKPIEVAQTPPPVVQEPPKPVEKPKPAPVSSNEAKAFIYHKESTNRPSAQNKNGACGLGQALPCSKMSNVCPNWQNDYACQDAWFTNYMKSRYGSWEKARAFWLNKKATTGHGWW